MAGRSTDIRALAIRFADLWAVDPHQMVDEIYSHDIAMENMGDPRRSIRGADALHAVEDRLAGQIPEHRHELARVVQGPAVACLETTVVGPLTREYAPACVWWWLDDAGKVAAEVGWFDWSHRTTDAHLCHGTIPPDDGRPRPDRWYEQLADRLATGWETDPVAMVEELFAPECTTGQVGEPERHGIAALIEAERRGLDRVRRPERFMHVHRVLGEGAVVALLVSIGDRNVTSRGTLVLTLDADDRIVSERAYCDWSRAVPRDEVPATAIASPPWFLGMR